MFFFESGFYVRGTHTQPVCVYSCGHLKQLPYAPERWKTFVFCYNTLLQGGYCIIHKANVQYVYLTGMCLCAV